MVIASFEISIAKLSSRFFKYFVHLPLQIFVCVMLVFEMKIVNIVSLYVSYLYYKKKS